MPPPNEKKGISWALAVAVAVAIVLLWFVVTYFGQIYYAAAGANPH
jgi:hypothetical protein